MQVEHIESARVARDSREAGHLPGFKTLWPWRATAPAAHARNSGLRRSCTSHFFHVGGLEFHIRYNEDVCVTMNRGGAKGRMPMVSDRGVSAGRPYICEVSRKLDFLERMYA